MLQAGRKAYPDDTRWARLFGSHYAQVLLGSIEPVTEYNVFRKVSTDEARSAYARGVRAQLADSGDARVLAQTALSLLPWGNQWHPGGKEGAGQVIQLARTYIERALLLEPESELVRSIQRQLTVVENTARFQQLRTLSAAELAAAAVSDRMIAGLYGMRNAAMRQNFSAAEMGAREVLELADHNRNERLYGEAVFDANIVLGKAALRRGDRKTAARDLLAAAETPGSDSVHRGDIEMNLPRALVDWGERRVVIEFLRRMAPKTTRRQQFEEWAAELAKGVNPDLLPTFSAPGCSNDPC